MVRHQLSKFLLRHGRRYPGKTTWNDGASGLDRQADLRRAGAADTSWPTAWRPSRRPRCGASQLTERLREVTEGWDRSPLVKALQALRGVEFVTAVTLAAEVGDFRRFATASDFMGYVGLIPSEQTAGLTRRQGPITKTGNAHVRHVLVESAWHYRRQPG